MNLLFHENDLRRRLEAAAGAFVYNRTSAGELITARLI